MAWIALLRSTVCAALAAGFVAVAVSPAQAQLSRDDRYFFLRDPFRPGIQSPFHSFPREVRPRRPVEAEPAPPEPEGGTIYGSKDAADKHRPTQATHYVVVMGDSLADQLAQGLADAFVTERPEIAIVKKTRGSSGLVRADFYDWPAQVAGLLEEETPNALVMMIGTNDRQVLRDESGAHEVRSDRWRELYILRIEALVNELKKKGVPIFFVGLPSMRISRLSADLQYINEILREQSQRLGVTYVDIWDGFVGENDEFTTFGPALDGQRRRLRLDDGVHFTRVGARKVAHYVERDLIRLFDQGPRGPLFPQEAPEVAPTGRPIAGPVLPLTQPAGPANQLAGGEVPRAGNGDRIATRVLIEGMPAEPVGGRADDFRWPRSAVTIAPPETPMPKAVATEPPAPVAASAAPRAAEGEPAAPVAESAAPLPNIITPSPGGARIISVPEENRGR